MQSLKRITCGAAALFIFNALNTSLAAAQAAKDLIGTWSLISVTYERNGKATEPYGPNPRGIQIFGSDGRFAIIIINSSLPKFASNSRNAGTAEENKAVVQGSLAYFGTYTASETDKTWTVHVEGATFPNWIGASQTRAFALNGDELTVSNRGGASGASGANATVVWRRVK
jgi:hypothetical protein